MHWSMTSENREACCVRAGSRGQRGRVPSPCPFRIAVLGARGVGKTAIVRRFLFDDYSDAPRAPEPSQTRRVHLSAAVLDGHVHNLHITEYPAIASFPPSSLQELTDSCCRGLHSAHIYVLVYDICRFDSFEYIKSMRRQIIKTRDLGLAETPILIVGNKRDLHRGRVVPRHNVSYLVRERWKCGYLECSAKFNWHVLLLFREALRNVGCGRCRNIHSNLRFQQALRTRRCAVM